MAMCVVGGVVGCSHWAIPPLKKEQITYCLYLFVHDTVFLLPGLKTVRGNTSLLAAASSLQHAYPSPVCLFDTQRSTLRKSKCLY